MAEKEITQPNHFELSGYQDISKQSCQQQRKPYKKPILQRLNTSANIIAGGNTVSQLENSNGSSGLIGS